MISMRIINAFFLSIDKDTFSVMLQRSWQIVSGAFTILVVSLVLSPTEQGFYYLVISLIGLQIFLELGMTTVIIQFISQENAHLKWSNLGLLTGNVESKATIAAVIRLALIWYCVGSVFFGPALAYGGIVFVKSKLLLSGFAFSWVFMVFSNLLLLTLSPLLAMYEACGKVAVGARNRLLQDMVGSCAMWVAMFMGGGVNAVCLLPIGKLCVMFFWVWKHRQTFWDILKTPATNMHFSWYREFAPFQLRIAISWISGYFSNQIYTPVAFKALGPLVAGQVGMSLSLANAVSVVAISWVTARGPFFGKSIALKQYKNLDEVFFKTVKKALLTYFIISLCIIMLSVFINAIGLHVGSRVLPPLELSMVFLSGFISNAVLAMAMYLRAHKKEPMLWLSVLGAVGLTIGMLIVARWYPSSAGIAGVQLFLNTVFLIPTIWLFKHLRSKWHKEY